MKWAPRQSAGVLIALSVFALLSNVSATGADTSRAVSLDETASELRLSNEYVQLVFDRVNHRILRLSADHTGRQAFGKNLLAADGIRFGGDTSGNKPSRVELLGRQPSRVSVRVTWSQPSSTGQYSMQLVLSLGVAERGVHVQCTFPASHGPEAIPSVHLALRQWFLLGIFDRGVVQYIAGQRQTFTSHDRLRLFYTLDRETGSVAVQPDDRTDLVETGLLSGDENAPSGIELRPQASHAELDAWTASSRIRPSSYNSPRRRTIAFQIYANDLPFPPHRAENTIESRGIGQQDSAAYFTAIYGSGVGVLGSYAEPGSAYPTLATPDRPYGDAFDFFDPDAWSTVTALSYSGDPLLQREARRILERSESALRPDGQVPHHFEGGAPTYVSIAKSRQTGPNIFWVIAASEYAAGSGNEAWLRTRYAHLRLATEWILAKYDPAHRLLRSDGPLFIDVFRRSGYTLDTNVAALYLLDRMAEVAEFCGDADSAERYRSRRRDLYLGIRDELWNGKDHFITQRNPDGSARDRVDYDSNFAALAFGLPDEANAKKLLHRLDSGPHTHPGMRGTWVSEQRYEKSDCYGENDGDSDTAMARIWWLDMAARVRLGDHETFDKLLTSLEAELLRDVWMPERYDDTGQPAHNDYYHEYPDIISVVLREMRYGVHVGLRDVILHPFGSGDFELRFGNLRVTYSPDAVSIEVPGSSAREFTIAGLHPGTRYTLSTGERLATDTEGTLRFRARAGELIHIQRIDH